MPIEREDKLAQLDRILHSRTLHGSDSLRAFLRFVVGRSLEGQDGQLKEYVIATEVFGRGKNFDSHLDSVVRVQAGRLRTKLHEYYKTEGRHDPLILDLPKGKYTPAFSLPADPGRANPNGAECEGSEEKSEERQAMELLWGELIRAVEPVLVVFSNTVFTGDYELGMKLFNSLSVLEEGEAAPALPQGGPVNGAGEFPRIDHYTGIGELMGVYFLGDFFARARHPFKLKRSLLLSWDDARSENIVVLGSPAENFFLLDLPVKQDFVFRWVEDEQHRHVNAIVNTNPQAGERELYLARHFGASPSQISEDYSVVSMLPGLTEKNRLMILAGINTYGTQAAAEYVTRPECIKDLIAHLNPEAGGPPRLPAYFQILLRVKVNGGVPVQISYVTHHVLNQ
jgi:hypothetical protein